MAKNGNSIEQDILRVLMQTRDEIRANMASKGINASGRTSASLTAEQYADGVRLYFKAGDRAPMETLEIGRPAGKVPYRFTDIIVQWSKDKGLNWGNEKQRRKIAGAVAWGKIRRFGTDRHTHPVDVYSTPIQRAKERVAVVVSRTLADMLKGSMESANNNF